MLLLQGLALVINVALWLAPTFLPILIAGACIQLFMVKKANESNFIDALLRQLEDLKTDSLEYWVLDESAEVSAARARILAQKIKGSIRALNADILYYESRYKLKPKDGDPLIAQVQAIFEACTSGDFESVSKKMDRNRYILIVNAINKLKSLLLRRKL